MHAGRAPTPYNHHMSGDPRRPQRAVTIEALPQEQADRVPYCVPGTPAERIAMVWPLTVEACSLGKDFDAQSRLPRSVVRVLPLGR